MNLYSFHDKAEDLHRHSEADKKVPAHFWDKYTKGNTAQIEKALREREDAIAKSGPHAAAYARDIVHGPFPKGEAAIAKDAEASYMYARDSIEGRFLKGEDAIAKSGFFSFQYARDIIKGPFPKGENAIAKDGITALHYAVYVIKEPFIAGEKAISSAENATKSYLLKFPERKEAIEKLKS